MHLSTGVWDSDVTGGRQGTEEREYTVRIPKMRKTDITYREEYTDCK